ncbi:MAG: M13 family metallopeptidase [Bacteroidota bacterium]
MRKFALIIPVFVCLTACNNNNSNQSANTDFAATNIDTTVRAQDDFFAFANGNWIKNNPIPKEESAWGIGNMVYKENLDRLKKINEDAAKEKAEKGSVNQKIGSFWRTAMDTLAIEKAGIAPIQFLLDSIANIKNNNDLVSCMALLEKHGIQQFIASYVSQDDKNSSSVVLKFWQGGLNLPEREYYLNNDDENKKIREAYVLYIDKILNLIGTKTPIQKASAAQILALETQIAKVHKTLAATRDSEKNYFKMGLNQFAALSKSLNLKTYISQISTAKIDTVIVGQPEYYKNFDKIFTPQNLNTIKTLLTFNVVNNMADYLPKAYVDASFDFEKVFSGVAEQKPRWKNVLRVEEKVMGELLGQLYVKEYFNDKAKKRYSDLVEAIKESLANRITKLDWMSSATKTKALDKLATIQKKVGYPDKWKDLSTLEIKDNSYAENMLQSNIWWHNYEMNKIGKPVDKETWDMTPQTYNAYYNPSLNEIVLPAAIFAIPGLKDEDVDDAIVYGYAGATTIGHEITHGFDDEGRKFDKNGNLTNWWTEEDGNKFMGRAQKMINQFNNFNPIDKLHINGEATLGENIADLGGAVIAWDAFIKTKAYQENKAINGYTPAQRFFLGYALGWLGHQRNEQLRNRLMTDVHSPAKYRVNGVFQSVPAFYEVWQVKPTDKMFVPDSLRVNIW